MQSIVYTTGIVMPLTNNFFDLYLYNDNKEVYRATMPKKAIAAWLRKDNIKYVCTTREEKDFTFSVNAEGYTISYKGVRIGGAGIMGKSKARGDMRRRDMKMYEENAKRDIGGLCLGVGRPDQLDMLCMIDTNELTGGMNKIIAAMQNS